MRLVLTPAIKSWIRDLVKLVEEGKISFEEAEFLIREVEWLSRDGNEIYEQRPAESIEEFIDSPFYLNCKKECWSSVREDLIEIFDKRKVREAVVIGAIGSGKSYLSSIAIAYCVHKLLCLRNPQEVYGLAKGSGIFFVNMSLNAKQARKIVFGEIKARVENSPWFKRMQNKPQEGLVNELRFPKGIVVMPGNSKEVFPRGFNLFGAVMDEICFYEGEVSAEEMYWTLKDRIDTRFSGLSLREDLFKGILIMVSNARYEDDFGEKKLAESLWNKDIYGRRRAIWEARPELFSGKYVKWRGFDIPEELVKLAENNPERFMRDFMARPCLTIEPWLRDFESLKSCIGEYENGWDGKEGRLRASWRPDKKSKYAIHIDLGYKRDACGLAVGRLDRRKVRIEVLVRLKPTKSSEVQFSEVREIVEAIRNRGAKIGVVSFDGFQSVDSQQILRRKGFRVEQLSVDRDMSAYDSLKELILERELVLPKGDFMFSDSPRNEVEFLLWELKRLERKKNKVEHSEFSSKDLADAVAGVCYHLVQMRLKEAVKVKVY